MRRPRPRGRPPRPRDEAGSSAGARSGSGWGGAASLRPQTPPRQRPSTARQRPTAYRGCRDRHRFAPSPCAGINCLDRRSTCAPASSPGAGAAARLEGCAVDRRAPRLARASWPGKLPRPDRSLPVPSSHALSIAIEALDPSGAVGPQTRGRARPRPRRRRVFGARLGPKALFRCSRLMLVAGQSKQLTPTDCGATNGCGCSRRTVPRSAVGAPQMAIAVGGSGGGARPLPPSLNTPLPPA